MHNSSKPGRSSLKPEDEVRCHFLAERDLVAEFRKIAAKHQRTFSGHLRKVMADEVAREREALEQAA